MRTLISVLAGGLTLAAASAFVPCPAMADPVPPAAAKGMKLILDDEFDGHELDLTKWQVGTNAAGAQWGSDSYFVIAADPWFASTYQVHDGTLHIRATYDADFDDPNKWNRKWHSGMIATAFSNGRKPSAAFRRGCVEIRQKFPAGLGVWPATWAVNLEAHSGIPNPAPAVELDGLEWYGSHPAGFIATTHVWTKPEAYWQTKIAAPDLSADFHVYDFCVGDKTMDITLDGEAKGGLNLPRADTVDKFYWMFNLAMGGGWPITVPKGDVYEMEIDYIRIWSAD